MTTILFDATRRHKTTLAPESFGVGLGRAHVCRPERPVEPWSYWRVRAPYTSADAAWWSAECVARYQAEEDARIDALAAVAAEEGEYDRFVALGYLPI